MLLRLPIIRSLNTRVVARCLTVLTTVIMLQVCRDGSTFAVAAVLGVPGITQNHVYRGASFDLSATTSSLGDIESAQASVSINSETAPAQTDRLAVTNAGFTPTKLISGGVIRVVVTVRNDGDTTVETQGPEPGFTYREGDDETSRGYPPQTGKWRIGVNFGTSELPYGRYPYRWGLGSSLDPGESRTITGNIRLTTPQTQDYWVGLVQEGMGWYDEGSGRTPVDVHPQTPTNPIDVYVLDFDPLVNGQPLTQFKGWNKTNNLMLGYANDVLKSTANTAMYRVVRHTVVQDYPVKSDGFVFANDEYLECVENPDVAPYCRAGIDYKAVLNTQYDPDYVSACAALASRDVDEIWLWGGPWFGYYEFLVAQPSGFNISVFPNLLADSTTFETGRLSIRGSDTKVSVQSASLCDGLSKEFTIMGFNYEREVAEMLEDLGHRAESALQGALGLSLWDKFDGQRHRYSQDYACPATPDPEHPEVDPNDTHCGNVHFPPNAYCQYQYNRDFSVQSDCDDWLNYPDLTGDKTAINSSTWDRSKQGFLKWWFWRFPRRPGVDNANNFTNWWKYLFPGLLPCPDFLEPSDVGVEDLQAIAARWRQQSYDLSWNGSFDLDEDGDTDVRDIMKAVDSWGVMCPSRDYIDMGKIAFESFRDGQWEIYVMNPDGSELTRTTHHTAFDGHPGWSPDGERLVFMSERDGNPEIYSMNADGSGVTRLTNQPAYDGEPVWSPNGLRIAFHSDRDGSGEIYNIDPAGTGLANLTENSFADYGPWWSSDGRRIAFVSYRDGHNDIFAINSDGSNESCLTCATSIVEAGMPSWSPNGRYIAFHGKTDGDNFDIYVIGANGVGLTNLTESSAEDLEPSWSPDGQYLTFSSDLDGDQDIYVIKVDGTELTRITHNSADDYNPAWSSR